MPPTPPLVTFSVFRVPPSRVPAALLRMGADRGPLRRTPGLRFFKLVGTGDGRTFTVRDADPLRWGLVAAWDDAAAWQRFRATSAVAQGWAERSAEQWHILLHPLRSKGTWSGRTPFSPAAAMSEQGPVAALTRARIRPRLARQFWRSVPGVSSDLRARAGMRFSIGFGEAPVGLQGTFSIWESHEALHSFAYSGAAHRDAIRATSELRWYREELFARFAVVGSSGTFDGNDPAVRDA